MDEEFNTVFTSIGWGHFLDFSNEHGSKILTLEFLSTVETSNNEIYFHLFGQEYTLTWKDFSLILGFSISCSPDLELATHGYNRLEFWHSITDQNECDYPWTNDIHNPTLCFLHRWIGITVFPRDDVRIVRDIDLWSLFAMV